MIELLEKFEIALKKHKDTTMILEDIFFTIKNNFYDYPDELKETINDIKQKLLDIGERVYLLSPEELTKLEKDILCAIYRTKKFTQDEIRMFPRGRCHRNHLYKVLRDLSDRGLIKDKGSGKKHYVLTEHGKNLVMWLYFGNNTSPY